MNSVEDIPPEIRQFIFQYLRCVEQLEILLVIRGKPDLNWSVQSVYDLIISSRHSVENWLEYFARTGVFEKSADVPATFRYIATGETAARVEVLAQLYKTKPARVIEAIYKKNQDPAQGMANAFEFKK